MLKILYSEVCLEHIPPYPHPERPERLKVALSTLEEWRLAGEIEEPPSANISDLLMIHDGDYVSRVERLVLRAPTMIDYDTYVSPGTMRAALKAAGASLEAAKMLSEREQLILTLPRPPGHHAGRRGRAMGALTQGFCIFNNAALAVAKLLELGFRRVAIIDFDSHHGNGTQEIFYSEPRVLHVDVHEDPATLYPGTGFPTDIGSGEGEGTKINVILPPGSRDDVYSMVIEEVIVPLLSNYKPEVVVYSAGFDGYDGDGLSHLKARECTYVELARIPEELGVRKVLAILEGGYSVGLERGLPAFISSLVGRELSLREKISSKEPVSRLAREYISELKGILRRYWDL